MEIDAGIAPECYGTPNSAAPNMGPRYSSDGAVQAVVRAGAKKIAFDQSNVPGTGYIAAGPTAVAKSLNVPDHAVQGQRADPGRELDRAQARAGRGHRRRRGAQLHASRGAEDPPGRAAAGPAGPREGVGLLDAVQHRLRRQGARSAVGRQAARQRRAQRDGLRRPAVEPLPRGLRASTGARCPAAWARSARWASSMGQLLVQALESVKGDSYTIKTVNEAIHEPQGATRPTSSAVPGTTATRRCTSRTTSTGPPRRTTARW